MATLKDKKEYFEDLSKSHYQVGHDQPVQAGSEDKRRSFIEIYAEDGLQSAMQNNIHSPLVVMKGVASGKPVDKNGSIREKWFNALWFLAKIEETDEILLPEAKQNAYDIAEKVMKDFIAKMWEQYEDDVQCGDFPFRFLDLSEFAWLQTEIVGDNFCGWKLTFPDEQPGSSLTTSDEDKWTYVAPSGASAGSGSIPTIDADTGGVNDPAPAGRHYSVHMHNVASTTLSLYLDKKASIDWGDGTPIKQYPAGHIVNKVYEAIGNDPVELKVYWEVEALNPLTVVYVQSGGATPNTAVIDSLDGDFPTNLWRFQVSNGLDEIPLDLLPATVKYFGLRLCDLTTQQLDQVIDWCYDNGLNNGRLFLTQTGSIPTLDNPKLEGLYERNWQIEHD